MKTGTKSGLFLLELILTLLLFALCAAICMQVFAFASNRAEDTQALSKSVFAASSAAECYKAKGGDIEAVGEILGGSYSGGTLTISYDSGWNTASSGVYTLQIAGQGDGSARIIVSAADNRGERVLYNITVRAVTADA